MSLCKRLLLIHLSTVLPFCPPLYRPFGVIVLLKVNCLGTKIDLKGRVK